MNAEAGRAAMTRAISSASEGRRPSKDKANTGGHAVLHMADSSHQLQTRAGSFL